MKKVMVLAWEIAREGVEKFGGKVKEYFAEALKIAWATVKSEVGAVGKSNVIRKEWTTSKGANIVFEYKTEKEVHYTNIFEQEDVKIEKGIFPTFLSVNGQKVSTWNTKRTPGKHELNTGLVEFNGQKVVLGIEMPEEISIEIYGEFKKPFKKETKKSFRCPKCGEYCWGDCAAN